MNAAPPLPSRYEPLSALGRGGGGEVWAVRDRITGKNVALKALREGANEREVQALVREASALSGVEGLGVPRVLRFGRLPRSERAYLVREIVEGESLADCILHERDPFVCLGAVAQAADKLTRLHRALLLHGDIKPANIIVSAEGQATLVDLGLAAAWREDGARPEGLTPRYAAPELFEGSPLTVRAEVFALGATLAEVIDAYKRRLPADLVRILGEVVSRATLDKPEDRFPSADEVKSALQRALLRERGEPAPRTGSQEDDRSREAGQTSALVWPIVALDHPTADLLDRIRALPSGSGIVVAGPRGSGRSVLLRRIAWSLGVEGVPVAWLELGGLGEGMDARTALNIEIAPEDVALSVVLIDDADELDAEAIQRLGEVREAGGRIVLVGNERSANGRTGGLQIAGSTLEMFQMPPLPPEIAGDLVRRLAPSLSDAVVAHVVARATGWPGALRAIVARLEGAPVVVPEDVDRILEPAGTSNPQHMDVMRLLDRGHFDEAGDALKLLDGDTSPLVVIARARLATSRGDAGAALVSLRTVESAVLGGSDDVLAAMWLLHAARAHLRIGDYTESDRVAASVELRLGPTPTAHGPMATPDQRQIVATEAMTVRGLAQSFLSRHDEARRTLERSVHLARALGEPRLLSLALSSLAFALQRDDQLADAKRAYEEAIDAAEQAGDAGTVATSRLNLAALAKTRGELGAALTHLEAAVDMGRRSGRLITVRQALFNLANLDLYVGRIAKARMSMDALEEYRSDFPPQQRAQLIALEAEHAARTGDPARGADLCQRCAEAYETLGRPIDAAEARLEGALMMVLAPPVDLRALERDVENAAQTLAHTTAHRALLSLARGKLRALAGDEAAARTALDEALQAATEAGQKDWMWRALEARSALEQEAGHTLRARRDREAALDVLEEVAAKLPRDLREVYWNDPRRRSLRASALVDLTQASTMHQKAPSDDRMARVLEINRAIAGEHNLQRLLDKVTDHAIGLLRAERGFIILKSGYFSEEAVTGANPAAVSDNLSIHASRDQSGDDPHGRFSRSIADRVIHSGEPIVTSSAREDARMANYVSVHQLMLQSVACAPIRSRTGAVIGALYLETRLRPAKTFNDEMATLVALSDQIAIAIETARLVNENERRAEQLARANEALVQAHAKLEELLGHRTAQLAATRRDLRSARAVIRGHFGYEGLVGTSESMRKVYALIDRVKDTDVPILIVGESGTGKEVVARAIHQSGPRAKKPFLGINCGAIPEHLLESELFGHQRGAFTGADRERKGLFREATEGTILLDEIGEMPQKMQAGLLRVLQEKLVRPVGSAKEEPVDTRVIAATHRDLARMVQDGSFREDLFYRLNVILVRVPPLRERVDDIPILIDHFLGIFAARYSRDRRSVSRVALRRLMAHPWPGNVRQLENVLLNAWVLSDGGELEIEDFELPDAGRRLIDAPEPRAQHSSREPDRNAVTSLDAHKAGERERILQALASCNWNRVKAAKAVGMPRRTFYRRLKEYGIQ